MDFDTTVPELWLKNQPQVNVSTQLAEDEWFILNIQETGTDLNIYVLCCVCVCACMHAHACVHCAYAQHLFWRNFVKVDMNAMTLKANPSSYFYFPNNKTQKCQPHQPHQKQPIKYSESLCGIRSKKKNIFLNNVK